MEISEVTDPEEFEGMRDEWNALADNCANPLLYSRHEWLWSWWKHYGEGQPLHIICARRKGKLKAIFPFTMTDMSVKGLIRFRFMQFIAQGESAYQDAILAKGWEKKSVRMMLGLLGDNHRSCEMLYLKKLHPCSFMLSLHQAEQLDGWYSRLGVSTAVSPFAAIAADPDDFRDSLDKKLRSNIRRGEKRLAEIGTPEYTCDEFSREFLVSSLADFFHYHEERWGLYQLEERGYRRYKPFVTEVFAALAASGLGRNVTLKAGDQWLAGQLCADYGHTRHSLMFARNPAFAACDLGVVMHFKAIQDAIHRGLKVFDFGAGEGSYKSHFAGHATRATALIISRSSIKGRLLTWFEKRERHV